MAKSLQALAEYGRPAQQPRWVPRVGEERRTTVDDMARQPAVVEADRAGQRDLSQQNRFLQAGAAP